MKKKDVRPRRDREARPVVRFAQALEAALEFVARTNWPEAIMPVIVQDVYGRIRLAVDDRTDDEISLSDTQRAQIDKAASVLVENLGAFAAPTAGVMYGTKMFAPEEVFDSPELLTCTVRLHDENEAEVLLLDRQSFGQDWLAEPQRDESADEAGRKCQRVTLYGVKGGVGRSTVLAVWAWELARLGKKVLVVDADFESPGVSSTLLPDPDGQPEFGLVDWFVEQAVGQGDALIPDLAMRSPLARSLEGQIFVAPSSGRNDAYFLPKLSRAYAAVASEEGAVEFAARSAELVARLEEHYKPDVVFLDSRSGLHDIAAVTLTQLDALAMLFVIDSRQSWAAYKLLFRHWHRFPRYAKRFREKLQVVAALVPETQQTEYLASCQENAWRLFLDYLYEEELPGDPIGTSFSYQLSDAEAPHSVWPVYWNRAFQEFAPDCRPELLSGEPKQAAFGDFLARANAWLGIEEGVER